MTSRLTLCLLAIALAPGVATAGTGPQPQHRAGAPDLVAPGPERAPLARSACGGSG